MKKSSIRMEFLNKRFFKFSGFLIIYSAFLTLRLQKTGQRLNSVQGRMRFELSMMVALLGKIVALLGKRKICLTRSGNFPNK